ncbi:hypothetical protein DOM21_02555 [Bacteriovorax stolpii]|uniref:formylglycine-generating enzyme family protein n=1 Tax=Bacteriovorax stolpii TaxID=960 RepID=UPI00115809B2|nr:formylglycine-generating enzyme family protein [Bacteriovorax stolpii]QDK40352.1 hypothetical protein DOM21_02555 [Bacteriovorax stolpii]
MKTTKIFTLIALFTITFFINTAKADEICSLVINGKNVDYTMCESKKKYSKLKEILLLQLNHALLVQSDYEAVVKKDNPIYSPNDKNYRVSVNDSLWGEGREVLERVSRFAANSNLSAAEFKKWSDVQKNLEKEVLAQKDFLGWKKKYNAAVKEMLESFSAKKSMTFTKARIVSNTGLKDILDSDYWNEKDLWSTEWAKIPKGKNVLGANKNQQGYFKDETELDYENKNEFEMQVSPVTQLQWAQVMGSNPARFRRKRSCPENVLFLGGIELCPGHPVENVSGNDVEDFIKILSLTYPNLKIRLPNQNEWEFAARGQKKTLFWFGSKFEDVEKHCWSELNSKQRTRSVKSKTLNPFGLSDTCGNVWQLTKNNGTYVLKGGSWTGGARILRPATKTEIAPDGRFTNVGFRLVKIN